MICCLYPFIQGLCDSISSRHLVTPDLRDRAWGAWFHRPVVEEEGERSASHSTPLVTHAALATPTPTPTLLTSVPLHLRPAPCAVASLQSPSTNNTNNTGIRSTHSCGPGRRCDSDHKRNQQRISEVGISTRVSNDQRWIDEHVKQMWKQQKKKS